MMSFFIFLGILLYACAQQQRDVFKRPELLDDGIKTGTLHDAGMDSRMIKAMHDSITAGLYPNIHSVLILRNANYSN